MEMGKVDDRRVALLGCGSLGSGIAELLAKSGVRHLTLVDPELLTYDNIGRSSLGAEAVGQNKASALKSKIERALPHVTCHAVPTSWVDMSRQLSSYDLTISTMAIWQENVLLNRLAIEASIRPIVYAWLEPHALAAHAVCIRSSAVCLECGFQLNGQPNRVATRWSGNTREAEPGCGGSFQPYGAIDLAPAQALVAELALDTLARHVVQPVRRAWLGNAARLRKLGGCWDESWEAAYGNVSGGRAIVEVPWLSNPACPGCGHV